ncbi:hypothetical protein EDC01DRAFT_628948 [Geopyxis carbonaria]|nr:hypothetical protein EDC01DRAFT_628948 [Geopyxis carbonaria]
MARTTLIAPETWELHKRTLKVLYKHKTLNEIKEYMAKEHQFFATKSQYQTQFNSWGLVFRKNMTRDDWNAIAYKIRKRNQNNRQSVVLRQGKRIANIQKEIARNVIQTALDFPQFNAPSPKTPEGMSICSPSNPACLEIDIESLPWIQVQNFMSSHAASKLHNLASMPDISLRSLLNLHPNIDHDKTSQMQFLPNAIDAMKSMMIPRYDDEFLSAVLAIQNGSTDAAIMQFFKFLVYLCSNKLLRPTEDTERILNTIFSDKQQYEILFEFLSAEIPSIEAFSEAVFEYAVSQNNMHIVERLLSMKRWLSTRSLSFYALTFAIRQSNTREILQHAISDLGSAIKYAISQGDLDLLAKLLPPARFQKQRNPCFLQQAALSNCGGKDRSVYDWYFDPDKSDANIVPLDKGCLHHSPSPHYSPRHNEYIERRNKRYIMCKLLIDSGVQSVNGVRCICVTDTFWPELGYTSLDAAAKSNDKNLVELFLSSSSETEVEYLVSNSEIALLEATHNRNKEIISMLVRHGADIDASLLENEGTALCAAASHGDEDILELLLDLGANPNEPGAYDDYPLGNAVRYGSIECVIMLLQKGADIQTALAFPEREFVDDEFNFELKMGQTLVDFGYDIQMEGSSGRTLLSVSLENFHWEFARMLVEKGARVYAEMFFDPWLMADSRIQMRNIELFIHWLWQRGICVDKLALDQILFDYCFKIGYYSNQLHLRNEHFIRFLVKCGADVNAHKRDGRTLISYSLANYDRHMDANSGFEFLCLLLDLGADPNLPSQIFYLNDRLPRNSSLLSSSLELLDPRVFQRLLSGGALPNPPFLAFRTPLQTAIERQNYTAAKTLIEAGAEIHAPASPLYKHSKTALQAACAVEFPKHPENDQFVEYLLENGAEVNAPAGKRAGATALQYAAMNGQLGRVFNLLKAGADINAPAAKYDGRTALEGAAEHGRLDVVKLLLDQGSNKDPSALRIAADLAKKQRHLTVSTLLENYVGEESLEEDLDASIVKDENHSSFRPEICRPGLEYLSKVKIRKSEEDYPKDKYADIYDEEDEYLCNEYYEEQRKSLSDSKSHCDDREPQDDTERWGFNGEILSILPSFVDLSHAINC